MDEHRFERETFLPPPTDQRDDVQQSYHKIHSTGHASYDKPPEVYPWRPIVGYRPTNDLCVYSLDDHHQPATSSCLPHTARQQGGLLPPYSIMTIEQYRFEQPRPEVNSHYKLSIFVLLCCAWPCGLAALKEASKARTCKAAGRYQEAEEHGNSARQCNILGIICGILIYIALGGYCYYRSRNL